MTCPRSQICSQICLTTKATHYSNCVSGQCWAEKVRCLVLISHPVLRCYLYCHRLNTYVHVCCGEGGSILPTNSVPEYLREHFLKGKTKCGMVTIIIFLRAPGRTYCPPPEAKAAFQLRDRAMASCSSLSSWGM